MMTSRKGTGSTLAVNPLHLIVEHLLTSDIMTNEVNKVSFNTWYYLLKRLKHELIDKQVVHRSKVRSE